MTVQKEIVWYCPECVTVLINADEPDHEHDLDNIGWFEAVLKVLGDAK